MPETVLQLNLLPGKRVIEAGTGSGALSHFLAQAVQHRATVVARVPICWPYERHLPFLCRYLLALMVSHRDGVICSH